MLYLNKCIISSNELTFTKLIKKMKFYSVCQHSLILMLKFSTMQIEVNDQIIKYYTNTVETFLYINYSDSGEKNKLEDIRKCISIDINKYSMT